MTYDKERYIKDMFQQIAPTYDLLNSLLSLNIHKLWRPLVVRAAALQPGDRVLDLATGTADLALLLARAVGPTGLVVGADFCAPMLRLGQRKLTVASAEIIRFTLGSADHLPFADDTFAAATMGFALRNVPDRLHCLAELRRVVRPGGRVVNLDLTSPRQPLVRGAYRFYQDRLMPAIGGLISGRREAYRYLPKSIQGFPPAAQIAAEFGRAGLEEVSWQSLTCGLATIHQGRTP